ncbi:flagellar hook-basal body complex protein FliE [Azorhizobium doebereinerae]|uniref:flagellar hook-basal body complex protein FliE n=1 Tax=Azorhizobium doebereinerae TaxID=281091 RepID=UPI0004135838|nr:flagellar hook-basal body complex protein FliE [Azorhizobium doebereinerae]
MIESISSLAASLRTPNSVSTTRADTSETTTQSIGSTKGADFSDVLANVSTEAMNTLRHGEAAAISGIQGKASVQQVVEAVMSAEQTLQTALAVRDKVVAAYQEVSRMAI